MAFENPTEWERIIVSDDGQKINIWNIQKSKKEGSRKQMLQQKVLKKRNKSGQKIPQKMMTIFSHYGNAN